MSNIFFTSDNHFWHRNVIGYCDRPYSDIEEMNEDMVRKWNSVVGHDDIIYHLGDFSMAIRPVEAYTPRLNGKKYLIPGNHDWCHSYHKKSRKQGIKKWISFYRQHGWMVLPEQSQIEIDGQTVNMCHHPYKGDVPHKPKSNDRAERDKYWDYRLENDGKWLICGHVHEKWLQKGKMINVGVDVWDMTPVSIESIKDIINGKWVPYGT